MPSFIPTEQLTTTIQSIFINASGVQLIVQMTRPDGSILQTKTYNIMTADKSLRDQQGNVLYPDVTLFTLGIFADLTNLVAKINTLHLQAVTDAKVQP